MNPLRFTPIYQQRIWGGREIQRLFARELPADGQPYGESWELVDREEAQSIVQGGDFDGLSLHDLWMDHRDAIFGANAPDSPRFPLLVKILDAREDLSLQVHPPAWLAADLRFMVVSYPWCTEAVCIFLTCPVFVHLTCTFGSVSRHFDTVMAMLQSSGAGL